MAWPRTISRGKLKGNTYASESEYRQALRIALGGVSRHEQRNILARKLGFAGYAERRKAKETIGEEQYLRMKRRHGTRAAKIAARENRLFDTSTRAERIARVQRDYNEYGSEELGESAYYVWELLYSKK